MTNLPEEESLPTDEAGLVAALERFAGVLEECDQEVRGLLAREAPLEGVFLAEEIHHAKQRKMVARYNHDLCKARLNRLRMEGTGA